MTGGALSIRSRRGAYVALAALTLIWGMNWMAMKFGLRYAHRVPGSDRFDAQVLAAPHGAIARAVVVKSEDAPPLAMDVELDPFARRARLAATIEPLRRGASTNVLSLR